MKKVVFLAALPALSLALCTPAHAWWPEGHSIIASAATRALPDTMPKWFRKGVGQIAHDAQDPDVQKASVDVPKNPDGTPVKGVKPKSALPFVSGVEEQRHFIDWEMLQGRPLPESLHDFNQLCADLKIDPDKVGILPYALAEEQQRLTMIFAESRRYPKNRYIHEKALVMAGIMSHYSGDLCMPLHVTNDHDGRALPDGSSPWSGIHAKVDSIIEKLDLKPKELAKNQQLTIYPAIFPAIVAQMENSRAQIDHTYALESQFPPKAQLPPTVGDWKASPEIEAFATERARTAANFTASLFLTAWHDSEKIVLPKWYKRE